MPAAETTAPPVFVPEWDSVLLAHADRGRIVADELQKPFFNAQVQLIGPAVLLDGFVVGRWRLETNGRERALQVLPLVRLKAKDREALAREGERLLRFVRPSLETGRVVFVAPGPTAHGRLSRRLAKRHEFVRSLRRRRDVRPRDCINAISERLLAERPQQESTRIAWRTAIFLTRCRPAPRLPIQLGDERRLQTRARPG